MPSGEAKFARIHRGLPYFAEVALEVRGLTRGKAITREEYDQRRAAILDEI